MVDDTEALSVAVPASSRDRLIWTPESDHDVRDLREQFVANPSGTDLTSLRPVIARSWMRSVRCGVDPDLHTVPIAEGINVDEQFLTTAAPVIEHLNHTALDTGASIWLADRSGTVTSVSGDWSSLRPDDKRMFAVGGVMAEDLVGTNGEGTAVEEGTAVQIWGGEHFIEGMQDFCCTAVPIRDPMRRSLRAVLTLALPVREARHVNPRLLGLIAHGAAAEVEQLLSSRLAVREQALLSAYLVAIRKRGAEAVVAMDERTTISSRGATDILSDADYGALTGYAHESARLGKDTTREIMLESGDTAIVTTHPIDSGSSQGALLRVRRLQSPETAQLAPLGIESVKRRGDFEVLVGRSSALRRTIELAMAAVGRQQPVYVTGDDGTGRSTIGAVIAQQLVPEVLPTIFDADELVNHRDGISAVREALLLGAVLVKNFDKLPSEMRISLVSLLGESVGPAVVLTSVRLNTRESEMLDSKGAIEVEMPALRLRRDDIPLLVKHFLSHDGHGVLRASPAFIQAVTKAEWSGNIQQLRTFVNAAAARCPSAELDLPHLNDNQRAVLATAPLSRLEDAELRQIRDALAEAGGNRVRAAELLEIGRSTLYRKMAAYERRGYQTRA